MSRVDAWFPEFEFRLVDYSGRGDWPEPESAYWQGLRQILATSGPVDLEIATEALTRIQRQGFPFPSDFPPRLISTLQDVYKARAFEQRGDATESHDAAKAASLGCEECGGMGMLSRQHIATQSHPKGYSLAVYCPACPMGRWLERTHEAKSPDVRRRMLDPRNPRDAARLEPEEDFANVAF